VEPEAVPHKPYYLVEAASRSTGNSKQCTLAMNLKPASDCVSQHHISSDETASKCGLQSYQRPNDTEHTWVPLSVISQATGLTPKALRKRVTTRRAPDAMVWRPDMAEIRTLIGQRAFGPSAQQGVLIRIDYVATLAPETTRVGDTDSVGGADGSSSAGSDKKRKCLDSEVPALTLAGSDHNHNNQIDHCIHKKQDIHFEEPSQLQVNVSPPPARQPEARVDMTRMLDADRDDSESDMSESQLTQQATRSYRSVQDGEPSLPPVAIDVAILAAAAGAAGGGSESESVAAAVADDTVDHHDTMHALTAGQRRRHGFIPVIDDGFDAETKFKLRVINAVSRSSKVSTAKAHQFRRVASQVVRNPNKPCKRSGSRNTMVRNEDLVHTGLFVEALVPSVGSCLRATIAIADDCTWRRVATQMQVMY
jgi:hypothetical protein